MEIMLKSPEDVIMRQDDIPSSKNNSDQMYFIAKGTCDVTVRDQINVGIEYFKNGNQL